MATTQSPSSTSPSSTSSKPWEIFAKGLSDIRNLATCKICTRLMFEPYTVRCGHAFCYGCLSTWLRRGQGRKCPDCRAKIRDEPCPDYTIRNIVHVLVSNSSFLDEDDTVESLQEEKEEQAKILDGDRTNVDGNGLFGGLFGTRHPGAIHDEADGVLRCPACNWELRGTYCEQCDEDVEGNSLPDLSDFSHYSDSDLDFDSEEDHSDIPNEEDDAFIDDNPNLGQWTINVRGGLPRPVEAVWDHPGFHFHHHHHRPDRPDRPNNPLNARRRLRTISVENDSLEDDHAETTGDDADSQGTSTTNDSEEDSDLDSLSSGVSEEGTSDEATDQSSNESEPRIRQRTRTAPTRRSGPSNARSNHLSQTTTHTRSNIIDLTTDDTSSPAIPRRTRPHQRTIPMPSPGPSDMGEYPTSQASGAQRASNSSENHESDEDDAPIAIRPRKRERIVLDDSDDEEEAPTREQTRTRRRRVAR